MSPTVITAVNARRVLLHLQGLSAQPSQSSTKKVSDLVHRLGYLQIDSINALERAHHLILGTRLDGYKPAHLAHGLEQSRNLFEHWTHDACAIPTIWFDHWKHRFARYEISVKESAWWQSHFRGDPATYLRRTLARIRREGPLRARDFEPPDDHRSQGWWEWHPDKAALEHLWRSGRLAVVRRDRFEKVYDLMERVIPDAHATERSDEGAHLDWACREAIARIGIGTPAEIARFMAAVSLSEARMWCAAAVKRGELIEVLVESANGERPSKCVALCDWKKFARAPIDDRIVPLCPFDPVVRERARVSRLFGFDYRFEAFTPAAKREFGYYVLPLLEGDKFIGRIDPKFDRASETLIVRGPWWEDGVKANAARMTRLELAIDRLALQIGAKHWTFAEKCARMLSPRR
ncbi:MAG: winged helix DNA-binding domain-containing protein [Planctomycetota bacterium]|nr:winged helix DNA-binding domain-containing protein [Planctomycetota bacterium]